MYHRLLTSSLCAFGLLMAPPAFAQTPAPAPAAAAKSNPAPALRRWLDVQSVLGAIRYRFTENSANRETVSDGQWQTQFRGRFLFDKAARFHIGSFVTTGPTFRSGWNYSGAGLNREAHPLKVRQLYFGATPTKSLELQIGGIAPNRGELADAISSDNDTFIIGERAILRPTRGPITQFSVTAAHFDAAGEPNFFKQIDDADDVTYAQALIGFKLGSRAAASVDYTYEDGRDVLREGMTFRLPSSVKLLTSVRLESYQRVDPDSSAGFNVATDIRIGKLAGTVGVMSADRGYGPFNGDRYELGSRYYYVLNYPLSSSFALQLYHTRAFDIDFPITLKQRFDFVLTYNPTAYLKRKGVF